MTSKWEVERNPECVASRKSGERKDQISEVWSLKTTAAKKQLALLTKMSLWFSNSNQTGVWGQKLDYRTLRILTVIRNWGMYVCKVLFQDLREDRGWNLRDIERETILEIWNLSQGTDQREWEWERADWTLGSVNS